MANKDLQIGDIVELSPNHTWLKHEGNPIGIPGEVIKKSPGSEYIEVRWENGRTNSYLREAEDLIPMEDNWV